MKNVLVIIAMIVGGFLLANAATSTQPKSYAPNLVVLHSGNTLSLNDEVSGASVSSVIENLNQASSKKGFGKPEDVYLFLNTPGGEIQAGLELIEALKGSGRKVHTITMFAASMGFQIAQNLGDRLILENGTLMSHRAYGGIKGEFGGQSPSQMENRLGFWMERIKEMDKKTANRTGGKRTLEQYQADYENELWLTGAQAVAKGYADKIVTVKCDDSLAGFSTHSLNFMGLEVRYDLSNCPLNTSPTNIRIGMETTRGMMTTDDFIVKGGTFGATCYLDKKEDKLCTLDTTIGYTRISEIKNEFRTHYLNKQRQVIYMSVDR